MVLQDKSKVHQITTDELIGCYYSALQDKSKVHQITTLSHLFPPDKLIARQIQSASNHNIGIFAVLLL